MDKSNISLTIRDNGKGLPEGFAIENAEGIGFDIIKALCRQISAELSYNSDSTGTNFSVIFNNQT
ncbi:hypothetical protein SAMN05421766_101485 [Zobellia uliginosa]|uniref:Histidine kinase-, DNA gyrase B-, and HSP90-like ATPase n=1 Tax=Zobellia uliginosa TaxID=143224 RepID=A0ABY1KIW2_9FLAO|nr:hypothetical protein [Zobellia uliginosa]SIS39715.1 hypothetical protein SAMN05421766_101485 [Zobellia uliginosa]